MGTPGRGRTIQAIDRAVDILELLAREPSGLSLAELSARLTLAPQTVQSLLRSLQNRGFVAQRGTKEPYHVGPAVSRLARTWSDSRDRGDLAGDAIRHVAARTGESVLLAELRGGYLARLAEAQSSRILTVRSSDSVIGHLHAFATGKVLLAYLGEWERNRLLSRLDLPRLTQHTIVDVNELSVELEAIRRRGYAVSDEEVAEGTYALAVGVSDAIVGDTVGLGLFLPKQRATTSRRKELLAELREAAKRIEDAWRR